MSFSPDQSAFKSSLDKLLMDMKAAVEDIQPINLHSDLQQFINGLITDTAPRFSIIVDNSYGYKALKKMIDDHLSTDFHDIETETARFEECRKVHVFEQTWHFKDFEAKDESKDLDYIKGLFEEWNKWEASITKHIQPSIVKGLLRADGKKLKDALQQKVKKELGLLRQHLFDIALSVNTSIGKKLQKIEEDVKKDMKNLDSYVNFVRGIKSAEDTIRECEEQKTRLEQMKVLLQKNRDKDQSVGFGSNS